MDADGPEVDALQRLLADAESAAAQLAELTLEIQRLRARLDTERRLRESAERTAADLRLALAERLAGRTEHLAGRTERPGERTPMEAPLESTTPKRRRYVSVRPRQAN